MTPGAWGVDSLPRTTGELRAIIDALAERRDAPRTVILWFMRQWLVGFHDGLDADRVPDAKDAALTALGLVDKELWARDRWRPKPGR